MRARNEPTKTSATARGAAVPSPRPRRPRPFPNESVAASPSPPPLPGHSLSLSLALLTCHTTTILLPSLLARADARPAAIGARAAAAVRSRVALRAPPGSTPCCRLSASASIDADRRALPCGADTCSPGAWTTSRAPRPKHTQTQVRRQREVCLYGDVTGGPIGWRSPVSLDRRRYSVLCIRFGDRSISRAVHRRAWDVCLGIGRRVSCMVDWGGIDESSGRTVSCGSQSGSL